jgi:hypothetical protein
MMKISVKLVASNSNFKIKRHFCINLFIKMVFTLEQDIFIGVAYFRIGNFDAANGW